MPDTKGAALADVSREPRAAPPVTRPEPPSAAHQMLYLGANTAGIGLAFTGIADANATAACGSAGGSSAAKPMAAPDPPPLPKRPSRNGLIIRPRKLLPAWNAPWKTPALFSPESWVSALSSAGLERLP